MTKEEYYFFPIRGTNTLKHLAIFEERCKAIEESMIAVAINKNGTLIYERVSEEVAKKEFDNLISWAEAQIKESTLKNEILSNVLCSYANRLGIENDEITKHYLEWSKVIAQDYFPKKEVPN